VPSHRISETYLQDARLPPGVLAEKASEQKAYVLSESMGSQVFAPFWAETMRFRGPAVNRFGVAGSRDQMQAVDATNKKYNPKDNPVSANSEHGNDTRWLPPVAQRQPRFVGCALGSSEPVNAIWLFICRRRVLAIGV